MPNYTVKQGDCLSSIAHRYGLTWQKIWNHPKNAQLQKKRKNPNIIYPNDVFFVPDKEETSESGSTEQRHCFKVKGIPVMLRLRFLYDGDPRANEPYLLAIDGHVFSGSTDGDGKLEHPISPNAKRGRLVFVKYQEVIMLDLGELDPIDTISGIQGRLRNLGYECGNIDGILGPKTKVALKEFQRKNDLKESGEIDIQSQNKLLELHGS